MGGRVMVMSASASALTRGRTFGQEDVLDELRRSSRRRASGPALIDEPGLTGVVAGTGPTLWATSAADARRVCEIAANAPALSEIYVDARSQKLVSALTQQGFAYNGVEQLVLRESAVDTLISLPAGYLLRESTDAADMPALRTLLTAAFDVPDGVIANAYPDDFFVKAAPARFVVATTTDGEIVGCIGRRRQHTAAMLFGLAVRPEHRSRQLARALVAVAANEALNVGAGFVYGNAERAAVSIAQSCGFEQVATWIHLARTPDVGETA
jgi:N-acetylglutamate synthase-like GNAT family acetyltransferase